MSPLFPALTGEATTPERPALRFGERSLTYAELTAVTDALADRIREGGGRVAVWATPTLETAVAVVAALRAGVPAVPLNPKSGEKELGHILSDSAPSLVLAAPGDELPAPVRDLERVDVDVRDVRDVHEAVTTSGGPAPDGRTAAGERTAADTDAALIVYTSGTTGPPKGAVIPRRAIATTLDALADAWQWTADDVLVHALPLFHVHGLILGILGPLRRGGSVRHLGRFDTTAMAQELSAGATMLFGVPTMYHRIAETLPTDPELAKALGRARLLVSGSAALPVHDHERIAAATGRRVIERYGMTETLMNTSVRADGEPRAGAVGLPLPGVELRLVEDDGTPSPHTTASRSARSRYAARTSSPSTSTAPTRPPPRSPPTAGSAPATWPSATPTATYASSAARPPTSSRAAATRSARARSRTRSWNTPGYGKPPSRANRTPTSANAWSPGSSRRTRSPRPRQPSWRPTSPPTCPPTSAPEPSTTSPPSPATTWARS